MKDLIILGTGNHDIIRLIEAINESKRKFNILGFLEKDTDKIGQSILGYPILGNDDLLRTEFKHCAVINNVMSKPICHYEIYNRVRNEFGITDFPSLIHPSVSCKYAKIGIGNIVYENVLIGTEVTIGNFNLIYSHTAIGHETIIGDSNLLAFNVVIGARSHIGNFNLFANSSTVSLGLAIGNNNSIGVGSVVVSSLKSDESVLGNPAIDSVNMLKQYIKNRK